jgi:hypothetical protein
MDGFGDVLGGLGDLIGGFFDNGDAAAEGAMGLAELFSPEGRGRGEPIVPVVYERYLCGGPRTLNINDR